MSEPLLPPETASVATPARSRVIWDKVLVRQGKLHVLAELTAQVPDGSIVAIVGSSGAALSKVLQALSGYATPDMGSVAILGGVTSCYLVDTGNLGLLDDNWTVAETVRFAMRPRPGIAPAHTLDWALQAVGLSTLRNFMVGSLNHSMRSKVGFACAFAAGARVLVADLSPLVGQADAQDFLHFVQQWSAAGHVCLIGSPTPLPGATMTIGLARQPLEESRS